MNAGNGTTSIKATLNPADPSCYTDNWNAGIVMINLSGSYTNGDYRTSSNSKSTSSVNGTTYKYDSKYDEFQETFTGSITGLSGPWEGSVSTTRYTNRQQVK